MVHPTKLAKEPTPLTPDQAAMVAQHQRIISMVAYSFTSDSGLVADLVSVGNESICVAAQKWDPTRGFQFRTYANTVIRNDMRDYLRRRQTLAEREDDIALDRWPSTVGVVSLESLDLERALDSLDGLHRSVVVESVFEGRSMAEIGKRRGKSNVWAWMRYHEALEQLRQVAIVRDWHRFPSGQEQAQDRSDAGAEPKG